MELSKLLDKAQSLPADSGCYLLKDKDGKIIYVGKAKKLKARVSSYFNSSAKSKKTAQLVTQTQDFEFIITRTEVESLVLENNLIKKHRPHYNVRLKDDKSYPYVQINWNEPYPRLEYTRRPRKEKGKELYGPYPRGSNISLILKILSKTYGFRDCSLSEFKSRKVPCLLYQMKQCSAPCVGLISETEYQDTLKMVSGFFQGRSKAKKVMESLQSKMLRHGELEEFEMASIIRDHIIIFNDFLEKSFDQKVESLTNQKNIDVWAYFVGEDEIDVSVYLVRSGMLLGQKNFNFIKDEMIEEIESDITSKIVQYYTTDDEINPQIVVADLAEAQIEMLSEALKTFEIKETKGNIKSYAPLLEMAKKHAEENQKVRIKNQDSVFVGLNKLQELLKLPFRPKSLECYDVAIWQGQSPTAAQVVFNDGKPDKSQYRYYHLTPRPEGNNDFAMLQEAVERRIKRGNLPDVFIIDGGLGQVNSVKEVLNQNKIATPVVGIAKAKDLTTGNLKASEISKTEERLIIPGVKEPFNLNQNPSLFKIIVSMRDEAHRFSRKLHHHAESKRTITSWLVNVPGLGESTLKKVLTKMTMSKEELRELSVEQIQELFSLNENQARKIVKYLQKDYLGNSNLIP